MHQKDKKVILIEGQGSLLHPGSTATLPLMRGSCPTHMILCHRAEKTHLKYPENIKIPPLTSFIQLNEQVVSVAGTFPKAKVVGIAVNTSKLNENDALKYIHQLEEETGLPTTDVIRYGVGKFGKLLFD